MRSLQKCAALHSSIQNPFNTERTLSSRGNVKASGTAALTMWRQLYAA
jgi:putative transposase